MKVKAERSNSEPSDESDVDRDVRVCLNPL